MARWLRGACLGEAGGGHRCASALIVIAVCIAVIGIDNAWAQTPEDLQIATSSSCDPQSPPQVNLPSTATGVFVPASRPSEGSPVAASSRAVNDWPWLCRYRADNEAALALPAPDVVFFGDSITENWAKADPSFFSRSSVNRGIGGQTSAQLALRFYQDVVALRPRAVHIIVGTNDVAGNPGALDAQSYKNNILAMADLARAHRIKVILGSIPPAARFPWRRDIPWRSRIVPVDEIASLNTWLRQLAAQRRITFIDYHAAMAAADGSMREVISLDGVHPNAGGYELMRSLAEHAVARTLGRSAR